MFLRTGPVCIALSGLMVSFFVLCLFVYLYINSAIYPQAKPKTPRKHIKKMDWLCFVFYYKSERRAEEVGVNIKHHSCQSSLCDYHQGSLCHSPKTSTGCNIQSLLPWAHDCMDSFYAASLSYIWCAIHAPSPPGSHCLYTRWISFVSGRQ